MLAVHHLLWTSLRLLHNVNASFSYKLDLDIYLSSFQIIQRGFIQTQAKFLLQTQSGFLIVLGLDTITLVHQGQSFSHLPHKLTPEKGIFLKEEQGAPS